MILNKDCILKTYLLLLSYTVANLLDNYSLIYEAIQKNGVANNTVTINKLNYDYKIQSFISNRFLEPEAKYIFYPNINIDEPLFVFKVKSHYITLFTNTDWLLIPALLVATVIDIRTPRNQFIDSAIFTPIIFLLFKITCNLLFYSYWNYQEISNNQTLKKNFDYMPVSLNTEIICACLILINILNNLSTIFYLITGSYQIKEI